MSKRVREAGREGGREAGREGGRQVGREGGSGKTEAERKNVEEERNGVGYKMKPRGGSN